jgi:hypothetical protein
MSLPELCPKQGGPQTALLYLGRDCYLRFYSVIEAFALCLLQLHSPNGLPHLACLYYPDWC